VLDPQRVDALKRSARRFGAELWAGLWDHRVSGLAAEVAFFSLFALPPALLALFSAIGFVGHAVGPDVTARVKADLVAHALTFLTPTAVNDVVTPLLDELLSRGRIDVLSLAVLFALWSTSRAADALLSALHVAYRIDEKSSILGPQKPGGFLRRRGLAVLFTLVAVVWGGVLLPLLVVGPSLGRALATSFGLVRSFEVIWGLAYWPVVIAALVVTLGAVYHFSVPWRTPYVRDLPGALFAMTLWIAGSSALRAYGLWTVEANALYGSLASPMILLMWLYFTAFSVLMGAEVNAAVEATWPTVTRPADP